MRFKLCVVVLLSLLSLGPVQAIDLIITGSSSTITISGTPADNDFAVWTSPIQLEGVPVAMARALLGVTPRNLAHADLATITVDCDTHDLVTIAQLSQTTTFAPPATCTPAPGQWLSYAVFTTVQRTLSFSTAANGFESMGQALPTLSEPGQWVLYGFRWNSTTSKWGFASSTQTTTRGTAGQCLVSNGPTSEPTWQACPGGTGGTGSLNLPMTGPNFDLTSPAEINSSKRYARILFDAAVSECMLWQFLVPSDYASNPGLRLMYTIVSGPGTVQFTAALMVSLSDGAVLDSDSFASSNPCNDASVPAVNVPHAFTCALTSTDGLVANALAELKVCRNTADSTTGDVALVGAQLFYAR